MSKALLVLMCLGPFHAVAAKRAAEVKPSVTRFGDLVIADVLPLKNGVPVCEQYGIIFGFRNMMWEAKCEDITIDENGDHILIRHADKSPRPHRYSGPSYGPFEMRGGQLVQNLNFSTPSGEWFRVYMRDTLDFSGEMKWVQATQVNLAIDGTNQLVMESKDSTSPVEWGNPNGAGSSATGSSAQWYASGTVQTPLTWKGDLPKLRLTPRSFPGRPRPESLWVESKWLVAKKYPICGPDNRCGILPWARIGGNSKIVDADLGEHCIWPIESGMELHIHGKSSIRKGRFNPGTSRSWLVFRGRAALKADDDSVPMKVDYRNQPIPLVYWAHPDGVLYGRDDSVELQMASRDSFLPVPAVQRKNAYRATGLVAVTRSLSFEDAPFWHVKFRPDSVGLGGAFSPSGRPARLYPGCIPLPENFTACGRTMTWGTPGPLILRDVDWLTVFASIPKEGYIEAAKATSMLVADWGQAILTGRSLDGYCSESKEPRLLEHKGGLPLRLFQARACLRLAQAPNLISLPNVAAWGSFEPGTQMELSPEDQGAWLAGRMRLVPALAALFGQDTLRARTKILFSQDVSGKFTVRQPTLVQLETPSVWFPMPGVGNLKNQKGIWFQVRNGSREALLRHSPVPAEQRFWTRLDSSFPSAWAGKLAMLASARMTLRPDGTWKDLATDWRPLEESIVIHDTSGLSYYCDRRPLLPILHKTISGVEVEILELGDRDVHWSKGTEHRTTPLPENATAKHTLMAILRESAGRNGEMPDTLQPVAPKRIKLETNTLRFDRFPATVREYTECITQKTCTPRPWKMPTLGIGRSWAIQAQWPESVQSGLDSTQAKAYCQFRGARLPTQAEWAMVYSSGNRHDRRAVYQQSRNGPQIPSRFWFNAEINDVAGNGLFWCQGGPCKTFETDQHCWHDAGGEKGDGLGCAEVPKSWSFGVRCVTDSLLVP